MSYDTWLMKGTEDIYLTEEEFSSEEERERYHRTQQWIKHLLRSIYTLSDLEGIEDSLQELAHLYDVPFPKTPIKVKPLISTRSPYTQSLFELGASLSTTIKETYHD